MSRFEEEEEGSWSLSFAGAGFLGLYYVGVSQCLRERAPRLLRGARRFYGASSGALHAIGLVLDKPVDFCCHHVLSPLLQLEQQRLGVFHPSFDPLEHIRQHLQELLPEDAYVLASQRLGISLTRLPDGQNVIVTDFATQEELIQALTCTLFFPFYCGTIPPEFRGERYIDGALSNNLPFSDHPSTITVMPVNGTADICPQSTSASMHELYAFNTCFQISTQNFSLGISTLIPDSPEEMADFCRQGYLDALRFLERRGLTQEPVLRTLVSKQPPAPAQGTRDAGDDGGQQAALSLDWTVPSVLIQDVPDFERLSPELEAALRKSCTRDSRPWARFCRSGPGRMLTYLLLPCTLPVQYVYFRGRRLVMWLPDAPADLWWMQNCLRRLTLKVYSRTKGQLAGYQYPPARGSSCGPGQSLSILFCS
ncbi:patatin-like phospholipase domain-containing protein 5 [Talpa occidentalis]|uniref:patatin-like phospholipase domain-containing protein 5 n=1 Tax=Talpa occidentalis TaxID=50954 RepID=UPI0018903AAE|nr:patatin-like phospholipase domain-containing protein 5 [Talpa occidentalis]